MDWHTAQSTTLRQTAWTFVVVRVGLMGVMLTFGAFCILGAFVMLTSPDVFDVRAMGPLLMAFGGVTLALVGLDRTIDQQRVALRVAEWDPDSWNELLHRQRNVWRMVVVTLLSGGWFVSWWGVALWWA